MAIHPGSTLLKYKQQSDARQSNTRSKNRSGADPFSHKEHDGKHKERTCGKERLGDTRACVFEGRLLEPYAQIGTDKGGKDDGGPNSF